MTGERFGDEELRLLEEVIRSQQLFYVGGKMTERLCSVVADYYGVEYVVAMSSGTAALHAAIGALEAPPGSEVITSPITDMGTLIGILYQNLIPVFADVDPRTYNITADTIDPLIGEKTVAIIVVHLAGNPADMDPIMRLAEKHDLKVIEDCAQAHGAKYKGRLVGTIGDIGCFSLNSYKHIACGDGGFAITKDKELYVRIHNFADKYYDRLGTGVRLTRLAPNYRITELQSAVAVAQMEKLDSIVRRRNELGNRLNEGIDGLEGVSPHGVSPNDFCTYWFTMIRVDQELFDGGRDGFATALRFEGIPATPGYIKVPIYMEPVFQQKSFFPGGIWPAEVIAGKTISYPPGLCPNAEDVLKTAIRLPIDENMTEEKIDSWVQKIHEVQEGLMED